MRNNRVPVYKKKAIKLCPTENESVNLFAISCNKVHRYEMAAPEIFATIFIFGVFILHRLTGSLLEPIGKLNQF